MKKGFVLIELMIVIVILGILAAIAIPRFNDSNNGAKAANVHGNLYSIQQAIDIFFTKEGHYPLYGIDIGSGLGGNEFSDTFTKYYSKGRMPKTPSGGSGMASDEKIWSKVFTFNESELKGGWLYSEKDGRLFARLKYNSYGQGNTWVTEEEIDSRKTSYNYGEVTLGRNGSWTSAESFDEYTLETDFTISSAGRIVINLEGDSRGYKLWIHPVMAKVILKDENNNSIAEGSLSDLGITRKTWYNNGISNEVSVSVGVSNAGSSNKKLTLDVAGKRVVLEGDDSIIYTPSLGGDSPVGIENRPNSSRQIEVGDITVTP